MSRQEQVGSKRLLKEYQTLQKNPIENIIVQVDRQNIYKCHFVLYGLKDGFQNGIYHGQIIFPTEYPFKPPKFIFLTPNGRFQVNKSICLSFTDFHSETWSPNWSISNMLIGLISIMYQYESGVGALNYSKQQQQQLAQQSLQFNLQQNEFVDHFQDNLEFLEQQNKFEVQSIIQENTQQNDTNSRLIFGIFVLLICLFLVYL